MEQKRKEAANDVMGQYVILRPDYENREINGGILDRDGVTFLPNSFNMRDGRVGYVAERRPDGLVVVQTSFYFPRFRHGDYEAVDPLALTRFRVKLKPTAESTNGALEDPEYGLYGEIVDNLGDPDDEVFIVKGFVTDEESEYSIYDLELIPMDVARLQRIVKQLAPLRLVSKDGFLPSHLPKDIQHGIVKSLTGSDSIYNVEETFHSIMDTLYGPYPPPPRDPLNVPLPYGPSEENFMGGKRSGPKRRGRKSSSTLGNKMARRGTRRSGRGIFSRLYAPVSHLLSAGKESVGAVTNTAKGVVGEGIHGLDKIGRSVTKHANMAVKDVLSRKSGGKRKTRGTRKSRKSRRNTRRRR